MARNARSQILVLLEIEREFTHCGFVLTADAAAIETKQFLFNFGSNHLNTWMNNSTGTKSFRSPKQEDPVEETDA